MLLDKIKSDSMAARKEKDSLKASLLTTLYSEALMVGKNKRNGLPTEEEVTATIQKFLKNVNEVKSILNIQSVGFGSDEAMEKTEKEIYILKEYLPKLMSDDKLKEAITFIAREIVSTDPNHLNMGVIMKALKTTFNGQYDGKKANLFASEVINGGVN